MKRIISLFVILALSVAAGILLSVLPHRARPAIMIEVKRGERMKDFVERLERDKLLTREAVEEFAATAAFPDLSMIPPPRKNLERFEGILRPGTYSLPENMRASSNVMAENHVCHNARIIMTWLIEQSCRRYHLVPKNDLSPYQHLILASIIEKESVSGRGYRNVSSVFYNRLRNGWRLCSCPTLEYALGYHRPFLLMKDLQIDSPYNLYKRKGLPPSPICFFTDEALEASINPPLTNLFFFVFDWTKGDLLFAETFPDHLRNTETARVNYAAVFGRNSLNKRHDGVYYENN